MSQRRRSACFFDSGISFSVFPADGSSDNSFLVKPYIAFSQKIGFRNENRDIFNGIYIVNIDSVSMLDSEEKNVSFKFNLNSTHDTLFFKPDDRFKAEESYSIGIKYSLDISEDEGQTFNAMLKDGKEFSGSFTSSFKIRPYALPQAIDTSNVELAYPAPFQYHFHRMETTRGVIKIKTYTESFSYYKDEKYKVRFSDHSGNTWENDAVYDIDKNRFIFSIPCENLQRETIYKFELVRLVSGQANSPILSWYFRTSKFDRFEDKLNTMTDVINTMGDINEYLWTPYFIFNLGESFDIADGKPYSGLVRIEVQSADWLKGLYSFYSQYSSYLKTSNRNKYLKIPPINGLILRSNKLSPLLSSAQIVNNSAPATDQLKQYVMFYVQVLYYEDYYHIRDILYNSGNYLITSFSLKRGDYPFKFYYYAGDQLTYESEVYIIDNNL